MYFKVTNIAFSPIDHGDPSTAYLDGCIGDRYKAVLSFYFQKGSMNGASVFTAVNVQLSAGVITALPNGDQPASENFLNDFSIGETIRLPQSVSNVATTFTITAITSTTLAVTGTMVTETCTSFIWVTNKITSLDYLYNLVPNGSQPNFNSLTDIGTQQKYIVSGIDASVVADVFFKIGTKSLAWVTDTLTGVTCNSSKINGVSITADFKQQFTITHYFFITPLALSNQLRNFNQKNAPGYYPLTYCYGMNGYYTSVVVQASISATVANGVACWSNQNNQGTIPEFTLNSIAYVDDATGLPLTDLDFNKDVDVTIKVKSASGLFTGAGPFSQIILSHVYIPLSASDYQNTSTTLRQNEMHDRAIRLVGSGAINGEFYGTDYQVFKNVVATFVDASNITITCTVSYSAAFKALLKLKAASNRNFALFVNCEQ